MISLKLSIIIVSWNTRELLAQCLESVGANLKMWADATVETFVVDNASTDGSAPMVRERFPWVRLIENAENVGFARANNQAIPGCRGNYVLLLNSDTVVPPGALADLVAALENNPRTGAAGPQMLSPDGTLQNSYGKLPSVWYEIIGPYWLDRLARIWQKPGGRLSGRRMNDDNCIMTERVSFACAMIRRQAFDQVGLLDEQFVFYSEDYDWFKRLKMVGWQVLFCPWAQVVHYWGASSGKRSEWALVQLYRGKRQYLLKHHGIAAERLVRAGFILRFLVKAITACALWPWRRQETRRRWRQQLHLIQYMLTPLQHAEENAPL